jgi:hypothetical protein
VEQQVEEALGLDGVLGLQPAGRSEPHDGELGADGGSLRGDGIKGEQLPLIIFNQPTAPQPAAS